MNNTNVANLGAYTNDNMFYNAQRCAVLKIYCSKENFDLRFIIQRKLLNAVLHIIEKGDVTIS